MKIGIIVAMDKELRQLQSVFSGTGVKVMKCGIGKVNAALGAWQMIGEERPDAIISTGCAGGNGEGVRVQDVVVSTEMAYHDVYCGSAIDNTTVYGQIQGMPARFPADPALLAKAIGLKSQISDLKSQIHDGLIVTGDWFVDTREKMKQIVNLFPEAKAVDMESTAIAQACHIAKVPFISFRIVSDVPLSDHKATQYHDFWSQMADKSFHITRTFVESL